MSPLPPPEARIVLRPLGNPLPLGFLALAGATTLVAALQLEWLPAAQGDMVALILLAFVAPLQLVSSVLGYLARDAIAGTGMGLLAGTWASVGLVLRAGPPGSDSEALGVLLLIAAAGMAIVAVSAVAGKLAAVAVLGTTAVRFALTGMDQLTASALWRDSSAVVGLVLAAVAVYAALAFLLEDVQRATRLPLGRRGAGRASMDEGVSAQLDRIEHEAGVREQL